jgi:hypothetical protein
MKKKKTIHKTVEQHDGDWPPMDSAGFIAWFQQRIDAVPAECRASVHIELDCTMRYDSAYATIEISYVRLETDEEEAAREQQDAAQAERRRADELRMLAELQVKYVVGAGGGSSLQSFAYGNGGPGVASMPPPKGPA